MRRSLSFIGGILTEYSLYGFAFCAFWFWSMMQVFFALALIGFLLQVSTSGFKFFRPERYNLFDYAFIAMIAGSFISCFLGVNPAKSLGLHAFVKTAGWMLMYVVARESFSEGKQLKRTAWILVWSALIGALYAVIRGVLRGEDRFGGGLGHPIHLGMGMNFAIALIGVIILFGVSSQARKGFLTPAKWILSGISLVACFAALIGSHASSGLIALFALAVFLAFLSRKWVAYALVFAVLAIFATGIFLAPSGRLGQTISKITDMKHQSVHERLCMWESALKIIKDHPMGIGIDNMSSVYGNYMLPDAQERDLKAHVHNIFLQIAAERGLPVLVLFLFFIGAFYYVFLKGLVKFKEGFAKYLFMGSAGVFTVLIVTGFFEYSWGASQAMLNFWFLTGMGMAALSNNYSRGKAAVFLDRDGTVNVEKEYLSDPESLFLVEGAAEGIKLLNDAGFAVIITTNQSGIGRGMFTELTLRAIHKKLLRLIKQKSGGSLDAIYFCKHSPEENCDCRKPLPGMIKQAQEEFGLDLSRSYVVGDKKADIEFGKNGGTSSILVLTGYGAEEKRKLGLLQPDFIANDLLDAAGYIVKQGSK